LEKEKENKRGRGKVDASTEHRAAWEGHKNSKMSQEWRKEEDEILLKNQRVTKSLTFHDSGGEY